MSQVASTDELVTKTDLATFYQGILPYLGGMPEMVANKFTKSDLYSTDEKIIGQWTDGKPLYKKTYVYKTDGASFIPTGISNIGIIVGWECSFGQPNNDNSWWTFINEQDCVGNGYVAYDATNNTIGMRFKETAWGANRTVIITIKYTKSTDGAISIGNDTDYSTDEKIIGTWVDGKPLYQKTVSCGALPNNTTKSVEHGISNIDAIISMSGFAFNSNHNGIPLPCSDNDNNYSVTIDKTGNYIRIATAADRSSLTSSYITIQYTKTTD